MHANKAWDDCDSRLFNQYGSIWSLMSQSVQNSPVYRFALSKSEAYVQGNANPGEAGEALKRYEEFAKECTEEFLNQKGCMLCGSDEDVVMVVENDGFRSCGRCRTGLTYGFEMG